MRHQSPAPLTCPVALFVLLCSRFSLSSARSSIRSFVPCVADLSEAASLGRSFAPRSWGPCCSSSAQQQSMQQQHPAMQQQQPLQQQAMHGQQQQQPPPNLTAVAAASSALPSVSPASAEVDVSYTPDNHGYAMIISEEHTSHASRGLRCVRIICLCMSLTAAAASAACVC